MGVIQSTINQALGTVGLAARLSPQLEKRALAKSNKQERESLIKTTQELATQTPDLSERIMQEEALGLPERRIAMLKQASELGLQDPALAAKGIQNAQMQQSIAQAIKAGKARIVSMDAAALKQENQLNQKKAFKKYPDELKKTISLLKGRDINE